MPIVNLQTDLKSLRYGGDRLNGGNSTQPFIKIDIPPQDQPNTDIIPPSVGTGALQDIIPGLGPLLNNPVLAGIRTLVNAPLQAFDSIGIGNNEGLIRGGISSVVRSGIDSIRLTRFLTTPQGLLFIAKQNLLSGSGVKVEGSGTVLNDKIYTPLGTLAQSLGNAFGVHTLKQGIDPLAGVKNLPKSGYYIASADPQIKSNYDPEKDNRLVVLKNAIDDEKRKRFKGLVLNAGKGVNVMTYKGGPGSVLGILGRTSITFADPNQRTGKQNPNLFNSGFFKSLPKTKGSSFSLEEVAQGVTSFVENKVQDFAPGSLGSILSPVIPDLVGKLQNEAEERIQQAAERVNASQFKYNSLIQSTFSVFKRPSPTFNFSSYLRLSNVYGSQVSNTSQKFNEEHNAINSDGSRGATFDFNVYKGNGNIRETNPQIQNKNGGKTWTQEEIIENSDSNIGDFSTVDPNGRIKDDFRKVIISNRGVDRQKKVISRSPSYRNKNYEKRTNVGNPGALPQTPENTGIFNYGIEANELQALNKISALEPYTELQRYTLPTNDLFTFRFAVLNSKDLSGNKTYVQFPAYINDFSDSYSSNYGEVKYVGRGDTFYNYQGFNRSISISFTVTAESKAELVPMYRKLNYLASSLAPTYDTGYMKGNMVELTLGWYLRACPGFLSSFEMSIPNDSPYEINVSSGETQSDGSYIDDDSVGELPLIINVQATFVPIHEFLPEMAADSNGDYTISPNARFISLRDGERKGAGNDLYGVVYKTPGKIRSTEYLDVDLSTATDLGEISRRLGTTISSDLSGISKIDNPYSAILETGQQYFPEYINTNDPNFKPLPTDPTSTSGGDTEISLPGGGGGY